MTREECIAAAERLAQAASATSGRAGNHAHFVEQQAALAAVAQAQASTAAVFVALAAMCGAEPRPAPADRDWLRS